MPCCSAMGLWSYAMATYRTEGYLQPQRLVASGLASIADDYNMAASQVGPITRESVLDTAPARGAQISSRPYLQELCRDNR